MEEITVTERKERSSYITYLYHSLAAYLQKKGGKGELLFGGERAALRVKGADCAIRSFLKEKIAEIIGIGYKYVSLNSQISVALGAREKRWFIAALIAADLESDKTYIKRKLEGAEEYSLDGFFNFRLHALREKWQKIANYVPSGFGMEDLRRFCDFLIGESDRKIFVRGNAVFGENFIPMRRSRLLGVEETETEIMLSDAGFVYCLGEVDDCVGDFLQKYYAERAVFS